MIEQSTLQRENKIDIPTQPSNFLFGQQVNL